MIAPSRPSTLHEAIDAALFQEDILNMQNRNNKASSNQGYSSGKGKQPYFYKELGKNQSPQFKESFSGVQQKNGKEGIRKVSAQELQYRRDNKLCYKCAEKYH